MKYNDKVKISITGEERSKNEIVYNNIIENLKLTEEEQWAKLKLVKEIAEEVWG